MTAAVALMLDAESSILLALGFGVGFVLGMLFMRWLAG